MTVDRQIMTDDSRLVAECKNGNTAAFESLVNRYQRLILNIAFRMTGNHEEACDITQETFLAAWRKLSDFRGEARFSTWLTAIVINLSRNRLQQLRKAGQQDAYSLNDDTRVDFGLMPFDPPCGNPSALDLLEEAELRRILHECMDKLPVEFREVLVLRDMQDFSYQDVGQALGIKDGTVKSRLFRARDGVKDCIKGAAGIAQN